jgi:hypothetical protein
MPELRLVTVSEDGAALVLQGDGPHTYTLPITEALRAAVRGDRSRLGQLEIALESQLTPKEIQTRIRHGESAEDVARAAGVPVERIRRFEGPVLGERDNIATQAPRRHLAPRRPWPAAGRTHGARGRRSRALSVSSARLSAGTPGGARTADGRCRSPTAPVQPRSARTSCTT